MTKEFDKKDLKTGMLVEFSYTKNLTYIGLVVNECLVSKGGWSNIKQNPVILKVSNVLCGYLLIPEYWTEETLNDNLLWERKEEKSLFLEKGEYSLETLKNLIKEKE